MPDVFSTISLESLQTQVPLYAKTSAQWKSDLLSRSLDFPLDRVNVLGDETSGHTGCVNALSWAQDGQLLLSGGDDTTVRLWRIDESNTEQEYPFVCDAVLQTGHRGNIFNAQLLPHSTRIATVARDTQVRICDAREGLNETVRGRDAVYSTRETDVKVLKCHDRATKRIVTEDSPDLFLTVSEDGTVRQHDLRVHHTCGRGNCPTPLVRVSFELSTMALSPLTPYQFVVAGESPYGYLFDRRQAGRYLQEEWGVPPDHTGVVTCVRRFGRASDDPKKRTGREHITGTKMATTNGHEVLMSYSSDAVYLYSTKDDTREPGSESRAATLPPNKKPKVQSPEESSSSRVAGTSISDALMEEDIERILGASESAPSSAEDTDDVDPDFREEEEEREGEDDEEDEERYFPNVPVILPRKKYIGACNVETVKDVNFLGPQNEFVVSGSDDGHFFIWRKSDGKLHDILEGDGHVVNVIEGHPHLPLIAVSGIDTTVKLFAPARGESSFSRMKNAEAIIRRNSEASSHRLGFAQLVIYRTPPPSKSDMRTEASSSSRRRDAEEWRPAEDRYTYSPSKDGYRRGGRDDPDDRDSDSWPPPRDARSSARKWSDRYEQDHNNSNQQESWTPRYDSRDRDSGYSRWTPKDNRSDQRGERHRKSYNSHNRRADSWGRDEPRDSYNERRRDNGWASRRRSNADESTQYSSNEPPTQTNDDRSWEPSSSWQSGNGRNDRNDNQGQRKHRHQKNKKGKKHNSEKKVRDWRNDDGHWNNWTRRDATASTSKANRNGRRQRRTPSRSPSRSRSRTRSFSRSRSPSISRWSYRSGRSSRGHSPISDTPRRRRELRSPSPVNERRSPRGRRYTSRYSRSPTPASRRSWTPPSRGRSRERSRTPSSISTSRSRTRSRSPVERSKTVHRLPVATSLEDVRNFVPKTSAPLNFSQRRNGEHKGRSNRAERKAARKAKADRSEDTSKMPPPALPSRFTEGKALLQEDLSPRPLPITAVNEATVKPASQGSTKPKNAGFKPIGQASSAVKRFFPGSDDDDEGPPSIVVHQDNLSRDRAATPPRQRPQSPPRSRPQTPLRARPSTPPPEEPENIRVQQNGARNDVRPPNEGWGARSRPYDSQMYSPIQQPEGWRHPEETRRSRFFDLPREANRGMPVSKYFGPSREELYVHPISSFTEDPRPWTKQWEPRERLEPEPSGRLRQVESPYREHSFSQEVYAQDTVSRPMSPIRQGEELYEILSQVGEGTFGKVYKARNTGNGRYVALKRIRMEAERDGFPVTAMREIKLLQSLRHDNIVRLYEMMVSNGSVYMVFEYMDHDLTGILSQTQFSFTPAHLKSLCRQMLAGLAYLHHKGVIHRDIKGSNILINNRGELKLGDFGLARFYQKRRRSDYTNRVITLWYRPPELLFGTTVYGPEVDMWSAGCIMLELFTKKPVFQGNDEIHQLDVIYRIIGTPTLERWPDVTNLPWYELIKPKDVIPNHFRELFQKWLSPAGLDLAEQLLAYDPAKRATAAQALEAPYFTQEQPRAERPTGLATLEGEWHELETKRERAKKRRKTESTT
ncbi:hypothetical protein NM688_g3741 [Phlebia brevispora]|uniref:Uncharacterized protein n=1 Tax=Phlebia brevispora TaxID=194682 RepID=A0ACC1T527_9APHY|nr:hypothetical protein NM688_g3741 [Phlebia brevispora]